jgi:hypothetical protein
MNNINNNKIHDKNELNNHILKRNIKSFSTIKHVPKTITEIKNKPILQNNNISTSNKDKDVSGSSSRYIILLIHLLSI